MGEGTPVFNFKTLNGAPIRGDRISLKAFTFSLERIGLGNNSRLHITAHVYGEGGRQIGFYNYIFDYQKSQYGVMAH